MRAPGLVPQPLANYTSALPSLPLLNPEDVTILLNTQGPIARGYQLWWTPLETKSPLSALNDLASEPTLTSLEALKTTKLTLNLWRQGRQIAAELNLSITTLSDEVAYPVTLFTGSWIASLLGYTRKYRSAKIIETFTGLALRSYLILYRFFPLTLCIKGPFSNFNFFWRLINTPAKQVFLHPILNEPIWDIHFPDLVGSSMDMIKAKLREALPEIGRGEAVFLDEAAIGFEAQYLHETAYADRENGGFRYTLNWGQVLFMPTRVNLPRKAKKARSIRKRLAKRLVRAAGRRFWSK